MPHRAPGWGSGLHEYYQGTAHQTTDVQRMKQFFYWYYSGRRTGNRPDRKSRLFPSGNIPVPAFKETLLNRIVHILDGFTASPFRLYTGWLIAVPALMLACHAFTPASHSVTAQNKAEAFPVLMQLDFFCEFSPFDWPTDARITQELSSRMLEAMAYTQFLHTVPDERIAGECRAMKYQQLALAALVVSLSSEEITEQQKWSEMALKFSDIALSKLPYPALTVHSAIHNELKLCRLISLGANYYQGGRVQAENLARQYDVISKNFLIRSGYCKLKILKKMDEDGFIHLPENTAEKFIYI